MRISFDLAVQQNRLRLWEQGPRDTLTTARSSDLARSVSPGARDLASRPAPSPWAAQHRSADPGGDRHGGRGPPRGRARRDHRHGRRQSRRGCARCCARGCSRIAARSSASASPAASDPSLVPGDVIVATGVAAPDRRHAASSVVAHRLAARLSDHPKRVIMADLAGVDSAVVSPRRRSATLRSATGALAVDMESHVAAAFAAQHGLPFAAVRVVCDPAHRALPDLVATALRPDGEVSYCGVFRSLWQRPMQLLAHAAPGARRRRRLPRAAPMPRAARPRLRDARPRRARRRSRRARRV